MKAKIIWKQRMSFDGTADSGFTVPLGTHAAVGGDEDGFLPMELFLVALGGCTGMDVISILSKKRQQVTGFEIRIDAERATEHPKVFTKIVLEYIIKGRGIEKEAVERAVDLSTTRYCPAQAMLGKVVPIDQKITIIEENS